MLRWNVDDTTDWPITARQNTLAILLAIHAKKYAHGTRLVVFVGVWNAFQNTYELLNLRAQKFSCVNTIHVFHCMEKIICVEFQKVPLKFHSNIWPVHWKIRFSYSFEFWEFLDLRTLKRFFQMPPRTSILQGCISGTDAVIWLISCRWNYNPVI